MNASEAILYGFLWLLATIGSSISANAWRSESQAFGLRVAYAAAAVVMSYFAGAYP